MQEFYKIPYISVQDHRKSACLTVKVYQKKGLRLQYLFYFLDLSIN